MAMKIMEMFARNNSDVIEVQYFNECGVGEGPTLEFFTLVSHEIQKKSLKMWRTEEQAVSADKEEVEITPDQDIRPGGNPQDYVHAPQGLFPMPYPANSIPSIVLKYFRFLGRSMARALLDGRLMDLNVNPVFFRVVRGGALDLYDLRLVDRGLGMTVEKLQAACHQASGTDEPALIDGIPVEDLYIAFMLPGTFESLLPSIVQQLGVSSLCPLKQGANCTQNLLFT